MSYLPIGLDEMPTVDELDRFVFLEKDIDGNKFISGRRNITGDEFLFKVKSLENVPRKFRNRILNRLQAKSLTKQDKWNMEKELSRGITDRDDRNDKPVGPVLRRGSVRPGVVGDSDRRPKLRRG